MCPQYIAVRTHQKTAPAARCRRSWGRLPNFRNSVNGLSLWGAPDPPRRRRRQRAGPRIQRACSGRRSGWSCCRHARGTPGSYGSACPNAASRVAKVWRRSWKRIGRTPVFLCLDEVANIGPHPRPPHRRLRSRRTTPSHYGLLEDLTRARNRWATQPPTASSPSSKPSSSSPASPTHAPSKPSPSPSANTTASSSPTNSGVTAQTICSLPRAAAPRASHRGRPAEQTTETRLS
jgi:hypothetical protein